MTTLRTFLAAQRGTATAAGMVGEAMGAAPARSPLRNRRLTVELLRRHAAEIDVPLFILLAAVAEFERLEINEAERD